MVSLDHVTTPVTADWLIGFADVRGFLRIAKALGTSREIFTFIERLASLIVDRFRDSSGRVIKFMGDAALIVFPGERADEGMRELLAMKQAVDAHLAAEGYQSHLFVGVDFGEATAGTLGGSLDILGHTVNRAAMLDRSANGAQVVITPEAFRTLAPETRTRFRKFTPPIVYTAA